MFLFSWFVHLRSRFYICLKVVNSASSLRPSTLRPSRCPPKPRHFWPSGVWKIVWGVRIEKWHQFCKDEFANLCTFATPTRGYVNGGKRKEAPPTRGCFSFSGSLVRGFGVRLLPSSTRLVWYIRHQDKSDILCPHCQGVGGSWCVVKIYVSSLKMSPLLPLLLPCFWPHKI